jgi:hypothetical protein
VKIFNWIGTLWNGRIQYRTPMMYALGFIWMFMCGGFTGIMHSAAPADAQQQDSYFVVAHFHYVLIGGSVLALLAGMYYWLPKMSGRIASERMGKIGFWTVITGFNVTFFPMHFLGLNGMPRRIYTYDSNLDWNLWNFVATCGALLLGVGLVAVLCHIVYSIFKGEKVGNDPWGGRTLEWSIPSPPPEYNFATIPVIRARDAHWHDKHTDTPAPVHPNAAHEREHGIHMPDQSWFPLLASIGLFIGGFGLITSEYTAEHWGTWLILPLVGAAILGARKPGRLPRPSRRRRARLRRRAPLIRNLSPTSFRHEPRCRRRDRSASRRHHLDRHSEQEADPLGVSRLGLHVLRVAHLDPSRLSPQPAGRRAARGGCVQHRADVVLDVHPPHELAHDGALRRCDPEGQS